LEYALRYGQNLSHLVLMNTGGDQKWVRENAPEILAKRGFSAPAVEAARRFYSGQVTPETYQRTVMKFMTGYFYHINPLTMALGMLKGPHTVYRPEALIQGYGQLLDGWNVMDRLGEIHTPTLVLAGRYCFLFPPEHQAILADRLPNAKLELIERAGHNPQMERPAETMRAIREFLAGNLIQVPGTWQVPGT